VVVVESRGRSFNAPISQVVGVAFLSVLLAGCGSSSEPDPLASPTTAVATPATTPTPPATPTPGVASPAATPTEEPTVAAAVQGFAEGLAFWTTDEGAFGAFSRRTGTELCLAVLYPEGQVDRGTVFETTTGQQFNIEAKEGSVLFDPVPAQTAIVTGDPATGLTMNYSLGSVRFLSPSSAAEVANILASQYPGSDGGELLTNNLQACP